MTTKTHDYILTISCPDTFGIVAAVSSLLSGQNLFITESSHFGDMHTNRFFMRTVFHAIDPDSFSIADLRDLFAPIAKRFEMNWHIYDAQSKPSCIIMVSRLDHCLNDLLYRYRTGSLRIEIPAIVANHPDLAPLAERHGIPFFHFPVSPETKAIAEQQLTDLVAKTGAEFVVLARYMQVLSAAFCDRMAGRVVNIHHSFLPSFKGAKPYHQAHARGVKLIGATAHFVTSDLDEGPIIEQRAEPTNHSFSAERMVEAGRDIESLVLARALQALAARRVFLNGNKTIVFSE